LIFRHIYKNLLSVCLLLAFAGVIHAQEDKVVLQLKWKHQFQFAGFYMAIEKGFYRDVGLDVDIREMDKDTAMFDTLSQGSGYYAIADTGALLAHAKGVPIKALAAIIQYSPLALMVKEDSPIQTFADLKGKRVMMVPDLNSGLALALRRAGLTMQDFEFQESSYRLNDLFDGKTDAFSVYTTNQPYELDKLGIPYRLLYPKDVGVEFYGDLLVTSEEEINQYPHRVESFLQASLAGWAYALDHMDETIDVIMEKYNSQGVSQRMLMFEAQKTKEAILSDVVQVGYMSERRWKDIAKIYAEAGMLEEDYPLADFIYKPKSTILGVMERNKGAALFVILLLFMAMLAAHAARLRQVVKLKTEQLLRSETRFKTLFDDNICVELVVDPRTGKIIEANQAAEKFYGYNREQLLSLRLTDINTMSDAEIRQAVDWKKGKDIQGVFQFKHKLADGSIRPVEVYSNTILWGDEKVVYSIVFDISPRFEARKQAHKFEQAIKYAGQAVMITDNNGIVEYVNPAYLALTGFSKAEAIGRLPSIFIGQNENIWEILSSGQTWQGKVRKKKKGDEEYLAMVTASCIFDEKGQVLHTVILQMDLSESERLEQQLQQAQKMEAIGTLVGGIAHDFNNMLAGIVGNLYLAKKHVLEQPDTMEKLNNIEQLSYKAADMISQLLTFARKSHVSRQPMVLNEFLTDNTKLFHAAIPENIEVSYQVCEAPLWIEGDETQLHQVLMNLMVNARDAVEGVDHPEIQWSLNLFEPDAAFLQYNPYFIDQAYARLRVQDNGVGIADDVIEVLFEPFFTTKEQGKGTGLGLAMVFGAVKSHQGFIEADNQADGGASFSIYLPIIESRLGEKAEDQKSEVLMGHGELLLLVDDEEHVIETGREVLESLGYDVLVARNGLQAVELFEQGEHDIALMIIDVVMPKMGGVEAVARIRKINPDVKVIFSTGYDSTSSLSTDGPMQDEMTLSKPYKVETLAKSIQTQLSK